MVLQLASGAVKLKQFAEPLRLNLQEVTNALSATYSAEHGSNRQDTVQRLALAREQFLETCTQLRDQLVSVYNVLA